MKTNTKTILLFIMSFVLIGFISFTYAYFSNDIVNNNVKDQVVETGTLSLRYVDGAEINMQNIKPGSTITKTVYVANTGTLDAKYNLVWQELNNTISNDEMVIEAKCTRMNGTTEGVDGTCEGLTESPIKKIRIKENVSIEPSIVHKYDITITFKEMNKDQNYNQNKKFTGVLGVKEYKAPETIYCTFDGEMVQGAEYVNGQYTYRYMQEQAYNDDTDEIEWKNITTDGWGVVLTDKTSTESVNSKVCTYINNKPVVSMSNMFSGSQATSIDTSIFNTSNVTDMNDMFSESQVSTLDLSGFDTKNVTNMKYMFWLSKATALDLSNFDTSNVTDMSYMFSESQVTTLDVSNFDTSKVTNMSEMFSSSQAKTLDLSNFDTSNVTNMGGMFSGSQATILDVSSFDTSNVTDMSNMFSGSQAISLDLSSFDTSKVTNMWAMFTGSQATTLNLSSFDTSNVIYMGFMFSSSQATTLNLSSFDTSNVIEMTSMFYKSQATTIDVSKFNTSKVIDMNGMFDESLVSTLDLSNFDTSKVTDMSYMFSDSKAISLDLSSFDTSNVTNMKNMFHGCNDLKTIYTSNKFVTTNVTSSDFMFNDSTNIVGGSGTKYDSTKTDKTYARVDGGTSNPGYFTLKQ